ncbi:MAG: hypothetical protein U1E27_08065, partial [Kiritimatiellia bacterium]|nr:hypothetical protein [Kiritimatiellia bacterium]
MLKKRQCGLCPVSAVLFLIAACAPTLAYYRGDEYIQRDFNITTEYFVDQEPLLPSLEERDWLRAAPRLYWGSAGSYTGVDLFNRHLFRAVHPLTDGVRFRVQYETDQDYDGIHARFLTGFGHTLSDRWALEIFGQPLARKQYADMGMGLDYQTPELRLRSEILFPLMRYNSKNDEDGEYRQKPLSARLDGAFALTPRIELFGRATADFPSTLHIASQAFDFRYRSLKPSVGGIWTLDENNRLWCELAFEKTSKQRDGTDPLDPENFRTRRSAFDARIEWTLATDAGARQRTGFRYVRLDETNAHPNEPMRMPDLDHATRLAYHAWMIPMKGPWALR